MSTANILGTGLIGGSIGLALKSANADWKILGTDINPDAIQKALEIGAIDEEGLDKNAEISFSAVPAASQQEVIAKALAETAGVVSDVSSVKASLVRAVSDPRFVGGHPMAGNELDGISGAKADLFQGAVWVVTPTSDTLDASYGKVREVIKLMGAEVVSLPAEEHDRLVALVSHVPHLTAGALMRRALDHSQEHNVLMRLAAGGFRDMTRIASGHPDIWLDICEENKEAITTQLSALIGELEEMREIIETGDREKLLAELSSARQARISLPVGGAHPEDLVEIRVPIPDRPGSVGAVATLASQLNTNIYDLEITHSAEGDKGTMILIIEADRAKAFSEKLAEAGYAPSVKKLG